MIPPPRPAPLSRLQPCPPPDDTADGLVRDRHHRLFEAASLNGCPEGDLLSLMPSLDPTVPDWTDGPGWIFRILGF
ncbi:hypothetical protein [Paragemmobacter straminiformis]|uniref:Uncharacterized protein n=1 Tax=Paragemmobacter straminiformis TaxID=2045119 RepID=A0A842IBR6_9RHOB|nr:hypothetical protein [Gemmobacter straminiformis]MBC2836853.1 hypothetical protein [Gemmobacter straminiformis]